MEFIERFFSLIPSILCNGGYKSQTWTCFEFFGPKVTSEWLLVFFSFLLTLRTISHNGGEKSQTGTRFQFLDSNVTSGWLVKFFK